MSGGIYGGDEVSGVVFDAGSHSFRVGFAGEEYPKFCNRNILQGDIPSYVAVQEVEPDGDVEMKEGAEPDKNIKKKRNIFIGTTKIIVPRAKTTIQNFMKDGMSEYAKFANGRTSGLVVDSGATHTSAVPVYDGYAVTHAVVRSPIGGDVISEQLQYMLDEQNIEVVPTYKIGGKASVPCSSEEVNENEAPRWTKKKNLPEVTESYDKFMKKQILEDMAISILQLCDTPLDAEYAEKLPSAPYSFPNGFTKEFLAERIKVPEGLFDLKYLRNIPASQSTLLNVTQIATTAAGMCDIDIRPTLYSGLMVTGGNSLILGFTERLNHDLAHKCPPTIKLRVSAAPTPMERRFGAWIGGSILGSLGSFQQMWIAKSEYDETGRTIVENRGATAGPRFPDGSINWQCPCMAGGSLVAHSCYNSSTKTPRGAECEEQFMQQALCVKKYGGEKE
ncbi:Actin [Ancylostoma ceylanicum]|uniref:Actin n=1 Tax=Ancylostoma ceylanicum TaxID=53326 RepID=A0A0D6L8T3_9BILA|nr:Actin [Ancylostoma ceylanicum]